MRGQALALPYHRAQWSVGSSLLGGNRSADLQYSEHTGLRFLLLLLPVVVMVPQYVQGTSTLA